MITTDDANGKLNSLNHRGTPWAEDITDFANWAYNKGRQDEANSFTTDNGYIKPKFKVGDKVTHKDGTSICIVTEVKPSYSLSASYVPWFDGELTEYKEEPLKVGDKVRTRQGSVATVLCIHAEQVWVKFNIHDNSTAVYWLKDLERV